MNTIKAAVLAVDETRPYLTSSPTNGSKTEQNGYIAKNPNNPKYGDGNYT